MNKIQKWLSTVLIVTIFSMPFSGLLSINKAHAISTGIVQSRTVADIEEFPETYQDGLRSIKTMYPNATFIYYDTGLDWYEDLLSSSNEMRIGRNLVPSYSPTSWKRADPQVYNMETNEYKQIEPRWNAASQEIISYYMDPRNFFDAKQIFQFEQLSFNASHTVQGTERLLEGTFMSSSKGAIVVDNEGNAMTYAEALVKIGRIVDISPYMMASRILQEQGSSGTVLCNGASSFNGGEYSGCYNYFNINASGSTTEDIISNGLSYAQNNGWTSPYRGLLGGAKVLASWFVDKGVDTLYLQHFNVVADSSGRVSYSPYMTNVQAPESEAITFYRAQHDADAKYVFVIPVYDNMPAEACPKPDGDGNGNYWLKNISINDIPIEDFQTDKGKYAIYLTADTNSINIKAESYHSVEMNINGQMSEQNVTEIDKTATLNFGYNEFLINVIAENGNVKTYLLDIVRDNGEAFYSLGKFEIINQYAALSISTPISRIVKTTKTLNCYLSIVDKDGNLKTDDMLCGTGDRLVIRSFDDEIILNKQIILFGDVNGDGQIDNIDRDMLLFDKLNIIKLSNLYYDAADIDKSGKVDIWDIVDISKIINTRPKKIENLNINIQNSTAIANENFEVSLDVPVGGYLIEGYLIYNNNIMTSVDCNNTGSIHFLIVDGNVLFENGKESVSFRTEAANSEITIDTRYTFVYNCSESQEVDLKSTSTTIPIQQEGINIDIIPAKTTAYHEGPCAILHIIKSSNYPVTDITIQLPDGIETDNKENYIVIPELADEITVNMYSTKPLQEGTFPIDLDIQYNINGETHTNKRVLYYGINSCNHENSDYVAIDTNIHEQNCIYCGTTTKESHNYVKTKEKYICTNCGKEINTELQLTPSDFKYEKEGTITAVVLIDGEPIEVNDLLFTWYLDDVKCGERTSKLTTQLKDVNNHIVTCVASLNNNITLRKTVDVINAKTDFTMNKISCTTLIAQMNTQHYLFRINDGEWQTSSTFKKLETGQTYSISRKLPDDDNSIETIRATTEHDVVYYPQNNATCQNNATEKGYCRRCGAPVEREIPGTKVVHQFTNYIKTQEATCHSGSIYEAQCDFGCGVIDTVQYDDVGPHLFGDYVYNNDATCTTNGTQTGHCVYGCDVYETIIAPNTATGHLFNNYQDIGNNQCQSVCTHGCGTINTITSINRIIDYVDIEIDNFTGGQTGLSRVKIKSNGVYLNDYILTNGEKDITKSTAMGLIETSQIYVLKQLSFEAKKGYSFDNNIKLYINGMLIDCSTYQEDGIIYFNDLGRFKT